MCEVCSDSGLDPSQEMEVRRNSMETQQLDHTVKYGPEVNEKNRRAKNFMEAQRQNSQMEMIKIM